MAARYDIEVRINEPRGTAIFGGVVPIATANRWGCGYDELFATFPETPSSTHKPCTGSVAGYTITCAWETIG